MSWDATPLKYACIDSGQYGLNVSADSYSDSGIRLIRTSDINDFGGLRGEVAPVHVDVPLEDRHRLRSGDILLSRSGTLGRSLLVPDLKEESTYAGYLVRFRPKPEVDPRFLNYSCMSTPFQEKIRSDAVSSTIQNFNAERYANIRIHFPDPGEQRRIADFLDAEVTRLDSLVCATEAQLSALHERLTEFMRVMTTTGGEVDVVFTGVSWMPLMNEAWGLRKVGHYFRTGSGTTPKSDNDDYFVGEYFWVNTGDLRDSVVGKPKKTVSIEALVAYPTLKIYDPGSLVVAMYGATTGRVGILGVPACVNQACCVLSELGGVDSQFAFYWFQAHREEILGLASGGGQPNISQELVRGLRIPAPDIESQSRIVFKIREMASEVHAQEALLEKRKRLLEERKRALITAAVTGQIDVTTARGADLS